MGLTILHKLKLINKSINTPCNSKTQAIPLQRFWFVPTLKSERLKGNRV